MWKLKNKVTGKEETWYEAELIEKIKHICKTTETFEYKNDFILGMHAMAKDVLDIIQEAER
jgi:hypothetical protein